MKNQKARKLWPGNRPIAAFTTLECPKVRRKKWLISTWSLQMEPARSEIKSWRWGQKTRDREKWLMIFLDQKISDIEGQIHKSRQKQSALFVSGTMPQQKAWKTTSKIKKKEVEKASNKTRILSFSSLSSMRKQLRKFEVWVGKSSWRESSCKQLSAKLRDLRKWRWKVRTWR